jgi:transcriptional regulator with XRE-family HTH domain
MSAQKTTYSALLGQIVSFLRQQKGIEQAVLAEYLGVSQASYSRLESGKALWSIDQLMVVSNALGVGVADIIEILQRKAEDLSGSAHIDVIAAGRANSKGGGANNGIGGALLAGAALGALLATLITRSRS